MKDDLNAARPEGTPPAAEQFLVWCSAAQLRSFVRFPAAHGLDGDSGCPEKRLGALDEVSRETRSLVARTREGWAGVGSRLPLSPSDLRSLSSVFQTIPAGPGWTRRSGGVGAQPQPFDVLGRLVRRPDPSVAGRAWDRRRVRRAARSGFGLLVVRQPSSADGGAGTGQFDPRTGALWRVVASCAVRADAVSRETCDESARRREPDAYCFSGAALLSMALLLRVHCFV